MATPSSSATSPSPPMAFMQAAPVLTPGPTVSPATLHEREQRKRAVEKFLARAELAMVTRGLRARLSYASYKAIHNVPYASIRELEAQTQINSQSASFSRTIAAKRRAAGGSKYPYSSPIVSTGTSAGAGVSRRSNLGTMAPPPTFGLPQSHNSMANGSITATGTHDSTSRNSANPGHSLYASILAPPPNKQARTILNANDPPVPAPLRPAASPRTHTTKSASSRAIAESTRSQHKSRRPGKASSSPARHKPTKRRPLGKVGSKHQQQISIIDADGDVDMKAAATLTSLLLHHRPNIAGSATSPRSSLEGSDNGSTYSYSQFAQSSARTTSGISLAASPSTTSSISAPESGIRHQTPPPGLTSQQTTPRLAPTDNEAADLMLFLATSPSPIRPSNKDARDMAAYRTLANNSSSSRSKGRVLFADTAVQESNSSGGSFRMPPTLAQGGDSSFNSSVSSIGGEMGAKPVEHTTPRSQPAVTATHLLPSASMLTIPHTATVTPNIVHEAHHSPKPLQSQASVEFNFNDFINASPSPVRPQGHRSNLGLRADVGRKLFEEEQLRHAMNAQNLAKRQDSRGLAASIDLVHS